MSILVGVVGALSSFYATGSCKKNTTEQLQIGMRLLAKMPTLAAHSYKYVLGQPFMYPRHDLGYVENFLYMLFGTPCGPYKPLTSHVKALKQFLILHADHEQNASTATVRLAGSSGANLFACIASGIASLWGPLHGGANEAVIRMLRDIGDPANIPLFLDKVKDSSNSFRLMGFGHRVYTTYDPRAALMRDLCWELFENSEKKEDPLFLIAQELEFIALKDPYFVSRNLYPNVDFYSGLVLKAIGVPEILFTVFFTVGRTVGWLAHWQEMMGEPFKISRPRQLYTGDLTLPSTDF